MTLKKQLTMTQKDRRYRPNKAIINEMRQPINSTGRSQNAG